MQTAEAVAGDCRKTAPHPPAAAGGYLAGRPPVDTSECIFAVLSSQLGALLCGLGPRRPKTVRNLPARLPAVDGDCSFHSRANLCYQVLKVVSSGTASQATRLGGPWLNAARGAEQAAPRPAAGQPNAANGVQPCLITMAGRAARAALLLLLTGGECRSSCISARTAARRNPALNLQAPLHLNYYGMDGLLTYHIYSPPARSHACSRGGAAPRTPGN